jgi:hypothetical protein
MLRAGPAFRVGANLPTPEVTASFGIMDIDISLSFLGTDLALTSIDWPAEIRHEEDIRSARSRHDDGNSGTRATG